jgi:hypothetical protein
VLEGKIAGGSAASDYLALVNAARDVWAGTRSYEDVHALCRKVTIYAERPPRPGVLVTDIPGQGRWTLAFSTLERLAENAGECDYLATTGDDFLDELVPDGVAVMLDPADEHRFPVLTRALPAEQIPVAWQRMLRHTAGLRR